MTKEEKAIETLEKELACEKACDDCGLNCRECNFLIVSKDLIEAYELAIKALKVWTESEEDQNDI